MCNFIKKETLALVFRCEICKIFKITFFTEHLRATASVYSVFMARQLVKILGKQCSEADARRCSVKKAFIEISHNLHSKTPVPEPLY